MLKLHGITYTYRADEIHTRALDNINIEIERGEFIALMGPSGCGKSTLLNIIGGMDRPSSGACFFRDENMVGWSESRLGDFRKHHVGFVYQAFNLVQELSVYRNVELALLYHNMPLRLRRQQVETVLERLGIAHRARHMPSQLSGGQQQRVAVARAIVANPLLLLADEPTGNLDSRNGMEVMELLQQLNSEGTTIIMATHNLFDADYAHRVISLLDGAVVLENRRFEPARVPV